MGVSGTGGSSARDGEGATPEAILRRSRRRMRAAIVMSSMSRKNERGEQVFLLPLEMAQKIVRHDGWGYCPGAALPVRRGPRRGARTRRIHAIVTRRGLQDELPADLGRRLADGYAAALKVRFRAPYTGRKPNPHRTVISLTSPQITSTASSAFLWSRDVPRCQSPPFHLSRGRARRNGRGRRGLRWATTWKVDLVHTFSGARSSRSARHPCPSTTRQRRDRGQPPGRHDHEAITQKAMSFDRGRPRPSLMTTGWKLGDFARRTLGAQDFRQIFGAERTEAPARQVRPPGPGRLAAIGVCRSACPGR